MPFCRDCGKEVHADWVTCPYCSASMAPSEPVGSVVPVAPIAPDTPDVSNAIGLQDSVIMGNVSINDAQQNAATPNAVGIQPSTTILKLNINGELVQNIVAIGVIIVIIIAGIWLAFPEWLTSDDDGDGISDKNDWYDEGNGGLSIRFLSFRIWDDGYYDDGGGNPDVYAYIGLGDGNCNNMEYYSYIDNIHEDASSLSNWFEGAMDVPDDWQSACVSVTIYDEDPWDFDDILDYVPGSPTSYKHQFNLAAGEGDISVYEDNRGENELSISVSYTISRVAIDGSE